MRRTVGCVGAHTRELSVGVREGVSASCFVTHVASFLSEGLGRLPSFSALLYKQGGLGFDVSRELPGEVIFTGWVFVCVFVLFVLFCFVLEA